MSLKLKQTTVALAAALGLSATAIAADYEGPTQQQATPGMADSSYADNSADNAGLDSRTNIRIPNPNSKWEVGVQYLLVQPAVSPRSPTLDPQPGMGQSGLRLEGAYGWDTGNDVNINWTHLFERSWGNDTVLIDGLTNHTEVSTAFDAINVEFGQKFLVGDRATYRLHFGAQFARIQSTHTGTDTAIPVDLVVLNQSAKSTYTGGGPRIGVDAAYDIGWGFNLVGHTALALLFGNSKTTIAEDIILLDPATANFSSNTTVPAIEGKLGVQYDYLTPYNGTLSTELGYQTVSYQGALNAAILQSNFSFHGPYIGLKWSGNA